MNQKDGIHQNVSIPKTPPQDFQSFYPYNKSPNFENMPFCMIKYQQRSLNIIILFKVYLQPRSYISNKSLMSDSKQIQADELIALSEILKDSPYKAVSKLSYGSYGEIFKIRDTQRQYVLKAVSKERMAKQHKIHEAIIEGFVLSKLDHPGIIKYYETIQTKEFICQVQEYCQFGDLFGVMKKVNKSMELVLKKKEIALFYLSQILQALAYLHERGLIHRDLKMENIVISENLDAKIVDFGTAKPVEMDKFYTPAQQQFIKKLREVEKDELQQQILRSKSFVGSANYLSPQSISLQYSLASDIWSYGILVYKIFHGKLPFEGHNNAEIFKKIKQTKIQINEKLQPQIKDLILKCLRIDSEERPTANQLKNHPYFKNINFNEIFKNKSPINKDILLKMFDVSKEQLKDANIEKNLSYQITLEKKMFFGNFKPRVLKMYRRGQSLFMSYWYLQGKQPKNQFELQISDYAQVVGKNEFDIHNMDVKYTFKVKKNESVEKIVSNINSLIRQHFEL